MSEERSQMQVLHERLEACARERRAELARKKAANAEFNESLKEIDEEEDGILKQIDRIHNPPPQQELPIGDDDEDR